MENETNYYTLKQIEKLTDLKYRQIQNRLKILLKEGNNDELIFKKNNKWFIHKSMIDTFKKFYYNIQFNLFITISSRNDLSINYWKYIALSINKDIMNKLDKYSRTKYVIERTVRNHLHIKVGFANKTLLRKVLAQNDFLIANDMNILVIDVYDVKGLQDYFKKQNKPVLIKLNKKQKPPQ